MKVIFQCVLFLFFWAELASAGIVVFNTRTEAAINTSTGVLSFNRGDFVQYDTGTREASIYFSVDNFTAVGANARNPDALSVQDDGTFLLSSRFGLELAGVRFNQHNIVQYDRFSETATILNPGQLSFDISGIEVLDNGNYLLAAKSDNTSLRDASGNPFSYRVGDIVEYDPETRGVVSTFLSTDRFFTVANGGTFSAPPNIDAIDLLPNGNLLFSTSNTTQIGPSRDDLTTLFQNSVYEFNRATGETNLFFDGDVTAGIFTTNSVDIKSFSVLSPAAIAAIPEPGTTVIGMLGLLLLGTKRNRQSGFERRR